MHSVDGHCSPPSCNVFSRCFFVLFFCFFFLVLGQETGWMKKDGCCGVQLGKIMNEVDRGWRRPSLKRNGSQQSDGDIDPSVTFFPPNAPPFPSYKYKLLEVCTQPGRHTQTHYSVHIQQRTETCTFSLPTCTHSQSLKHPVHLFLFLI